jgi:hypothetical protein
MKKISVAFVLFAALLLSSCVVQQPSGPTGGTISQERFNSSTTGSLVANLGDGFFNCDRAIRTATRSFHLIELSRTNRQSEITYEYKDINDDRLTIVLTAVSIRSSRVDIKFGKTGNRNLSKNLLNKIGDELDSMAAARDQQ